VPWIWSTTENFFSKWRGGGKGLVRARRRSGNDEDVDKAKCYDRKAETQVQETNKRKLKKIKELKQKRCKVKFKSESRCKRKSCNFRIEDSTVERETIAIEKIRCDNSLLKKGDVVASRLLLIYAFI
jgi:hypothetical protein